VTVSLDGENFAESPAVFTWYDGHCTVCEIDGTCGDNPDSCTVDGTCYLAGDVSDENLCRRCVPEKSSTEWSWSYVDHDVCGPVFPRTTYSARIVGSAEENEVITSVNAVNDLVCDDTQNQITYTL
jgi:hypothetical protein